MYAVETDNVYIISLLSRSFYSNINIQDNYDNPAFMYACLLKYLEIEVYLPKLYMDLYIKDNDGNNSIDYTKQHFTPAEISRIFNR